jgi:hypothetical protein
MPKPLFLLTTIFFLLIAGGRARANDPGAGPTFGERGQVILDANVHGKIERVNATFQSQSRSATRIELAPSAMFFIAPNFALGGTLSYAFEKQEGATRSAFGIGPSLGYNVALSDKASFFPNAGLLFVNSAQTIEGTPSVTGHQLVAALNFPVLLHLVPHFFVGVGPYVGWVLESKVEGQDAPKATLYGIALFIGGWL